MPRVKATEKQKSYIRALQRKNGFKVAKVEAPYLNLMSKETASRWIKELLAGKNPHRPIDTTTN